MMQYFDSELAFNRAIEQERLSNDESKSNFAGNYMYMGTFIDEQGTGKDLFKNSCTRKYDV